MIRFYLINLLRLCIRVVSRGGGGGGIAGSGGRGGGIAGGGVGCGSVRDTGVGAAGGTGQVSAEVRLEVRPQTL